MIIPESRISQEKMKKMGKKQAKTSESSEKKMFE